MEPNMNLDSIVTLLEGLADESSPVFNELRDLYEVTLHNMQHPEDFIPYDSTMLIPLAYMDEWNGTEAVYMIRAILELEVNDELLGLRTNSPTKVELSICPDLLKFYDNYIVLSDKSVPASIDYYDHIGRLIKSEQRIADIPGTEISMLKQNKVFLIHITQNGCSRAYKLP